jgi:hypothetical protein
MAALSLNTRMGLLIMPIDPKDVVWDEEAPKSESKAPPSDIQWDEEPDPYVEAAAGFGRGLAKGVAAAPGIIGDIQSVARAVEPYIGIKTPEHPLIKFPTSAETTEMAKPAVRALSEESKTLPGKFAETVGEFAAMPGAGKTPAQIMSRTVLPAVGSEAAGQMTEGTAAEPYARFAGAVMASPAAAVAPKMAQTLEAGKRIGVDLPYFVASESGVPKAMAQVSKAIPIGGGAVTEASQKAVGQMGQAMEDVHNVLGAGTAPTAGTAAKSGITDWMKGKSQTMLRDAYDDVGRHVNPEAKTPLQNLSKTVQELTDRRLASDLDPGKSEAINLAIGPATNPNGLTYEGIKNLRTTIGEMLDTGLLPANTSKAELKSIYGALTNDLQASVMASGGPRAQQLFNRANSMAKAVAERREKLAKIVGLEGDVAPEQVLGRIQRMAQAGTKGDINALILARRTIPPHDWEHVTSGLVETLGRAPEGNFSPDRFITGYAKMSDMGKDVMFGPKGNAVRDALEDINTVSSKFKELGQYTNVSKTANVQQAAQLFTTILAAPFFPHAAAGAAASIPANFMMAKALSSPLTARAAANLQKAIYNAKVGMAPAEIGEQRIRAAAQAYIDAVGKVTGEEQKSEERTERKSGGRVDKRDYPAKRLNKLERAARRAFNEIAHETKPLMDVPDEHIVQALDQVK